MVLLQIALSSPTGEDKYEGKRRKLDINGIKKEGRKKAT
jgi:hypothetical protein